MNVNQSYLLVRRKVRYVYFGINNSTILMKCATHDDIQVWLVLCHVPERCACIFAISALFSWTVQLAGSKKWSGKLLPPEQYNVLLNRETTKQQSRFFKRNQGALSDHAGEMQIIS